MDQNIGLMLIMFVAIIFFMVLPNMRRAKKEKQFASQLKKGDRVIMKSGLHGKVFDFSDKNDAVIVETGSGKLTFDRSSISMDMSQKLNTPAVEKK